MITGNNTRIRLIALCRKKLLEFFQSTQGEKTIQFEDFAREVKREVIELDKEKMLGRIYNQHRVTYSGGRDPAKVYTQEHLDRDIYLVNNVLDLINQFIFQAEDVLQSYQTLSLADPKDYTETSASPSGPRTEGETGSEASRPTSTKSLLPGEVSYNLGGRRKRPINARLMSILERAATELNTHEKLTDFSIQIYSGGQPSMADEGGVKVTKDRTGSARHDYGFGADIRCFKGGRRLSAWHDDDLELVKIIVRVLLKHGIHSVGIGRPYSGYMNGDTHVDIATGNPDGYGDPIKRLCWGAGGSSARAPSWLVQIYKE